jgi:rubrerythrin
MSYYCPNCGHSSNDTGPYCPHCGEPKKNAPK